MVVDQKDVLTRLQQARSQSQSGTSSPFFFLKDGEKALVHLMRNYDEMVAVSSHRKFDEITRKYIHHVCAQEFDQVCQICLDAKDDWKLRAQDFFYMPAYVHSKIGADGQKREIAQVLYLEMANYDGILAGLEGIFYAQDGVKGNLTQQDYVISRVGSGSKTKYTVVERKNAPAALPGGLLLPSDEKIRSDVELAHPAKPVDDGVALGDIQISKADTSFMPDEFGDEF